MLLASVNSENDGVRMLRFGSFKVQMSAKNGNTDSHYPFSRYPAGSEV